MDSSVVDKVADFERALLAMDEAKARGMLLEPDGRPIPLEEAEALIVPALERIGRGWEEGSVALSQVYMSGRHCESLMKELQPRAGAAPSGGPRIAIALLEDYHFLGMRLVSSVLRASGFALIDYGRMDVESLARKALADELDILLVSVLMLRSALLVRELRGRLDSGGGNMALAVGGAPFRLDKELWREVGADGTADTASGALDLVRRLAGEAAR